MKLETLESPLWTAVVRVILVSICLAAAVAAAAACGGGEGGTPEPGPTAVPGPTTPADGKEAAVTPSPAPTAAPRATSLPEEATGTMAESDGEDATTRASTPTTAGSEIVPDVIFTEVDADATMASEEVDPGRQYVPASIEAGEVDDNLRWQEYLDYRRNYQGPAVHDVDVSERYVINVSGRDGRPVPNAEVRVSAGEAVIFEGRTYANGKTLFFPRAFPETEGVEEFRLHVEKGGAGLSQVFRRNTELEWNAALDVEVSYADRVPLDVLFLLDATGSMSDEIAQLKTTLLSISGRISDLPSQPDLRLGMVTYRDRGDEFITRVYDFTSDVSRFLDSIRGVSADGGQDNPESLNEALHDAVHEPDWRLRDAIRLVFLLADAPPHLDYPQDYDYAVEMVQAHRRGIKIFSIASSGLDGQGEYIFRQIAQHTTGRFIFIVYGGGEEGPITPHDVSDYTVERLDDLVVRLVKEELAAIE